jgi:hypothetical protein
MWRKNGFNLTFVSGVALMCLISSAMAFAQMNTPGHPKADTEKIADALRAGPAFITKDATLLDWPAAPGGEYRVLRKGSNEWTCLPGIPGYPHDEPGCFDQVFLRWIQDSLAGRTPQIGPAPGEDAFTGRDRGIRSVNTLTRFGFGDDAACARSLIHLRSASLQMTDAMASSFCSLGRQMPLRDTAEGIG